MPQQVTFLIRNASTTVINLTNRKEGHLPANYYPTLKKVDSKKQVLRSKQ
jgi:hypothetical protein